MTQPDKPTKPAKPEHPGKPAQPAMPGVIDFDLSIVETGPAPSKRTTPKKGHGPLVHIVCLACDGTADSRDRKMVIRAADIHARTAHNGASARVRSVPAATT